MNIFITCLTSDSHLPKKFVLFAWLKVLKNDGKCLLFHLKNSFRSQDILVFVTTFSSCRKNGLLKMIKLTSNSWRLIYKELYYTYCPISHKVKANQTLKLGQLIEWQEKYFSSKWGKDTSSRHLFILKKSLIWCESKWSAA